MEKQRLDAAGVAQKQADLLALTDEALRLQTQAIRQNFNAWMASMFDLSESQLQQLDEMPASFRSELANAIADTLDQRAVISFSKDAQANRPVNPKDVLIVRQQSTNWRVGETEPTVSGLLSIQISYS